MGRTDPLPGPARKVFGPNAVLRLTVRDRDGHAAETLAAPSDT
ncbi:hypothetical protein GCM10023168_33750 [Fodinibacter luteus]|uniref:Uncharacterized protein n=1 Tax=Fodinibacter luteus TaxID=552064 RepID=A0ABP8KP14_9MICO